MSLVYRSLKLNFRCTCCCLTLQWNNNQISSLSHPLPWNVFVPINVWFPLQNDRKILVVCRLFVTSKFNPIRFDFFSWCGESPWVSIRMPARNTFLSFQNPIIKCRALFAWVMVPNDFPNLKKKKITMEKMPGEEKQKTGSLVSLSSVNAGDGRDREVPLGFFVHLGSDSVNYFTF